MIDFLLKRLVRAAITIWAVVTLVFVFLRCAGDPVLMLLPDNAPVEMVDAFRQEWGLDQPIYIQYFRYLGNIAVGDFGRSYHDGRSAFEVVLSALPKTLLLGSTALLFAIFLGIPAGILAATQRGKTWDRLIVAISVLGYSLPSFFIGIVLVLIFSLTLRWLPSSGSASVAHLILPATTLGLWIAASVARLTRSSLLEAMSESYMETARSKGVSYFRRVIVHALPNAANPIVTVLGLAAGHIVAGSIIVETVFAWPGLGRLTMTAVAARELAIVQAVVMLVAAGMVLANLTVDILYGVFDPRLRETRR